MATGMAGVSHTRDKNLTSKPAHNASMKTPRLNRRQLLHSAGAGLLMVIPGAPWAQATTLPEIALSASDGLPVLAAQAAANKGLSQRSLCCGWP